MSSRRLPKNIIIDHSNPLITHVTIIGKFIPHSNEDYMKLTRLAWSFRRATELMIREIVKGVEMRGFAENLYIILPNYIYLESAYKHAKLIVESCRSNNGNIMHIHIRKLFILSRGNKYDYGNRNVRLIAGKDYFEVLIRYPWDNSWIRAKVLFGERYVPLLKELVELSKNRVEGYGVKVVFRKHRIELHISVPLYLYLKYFSFPKYNGYGLIAGVDLNSDRINMVVIDKDGRIVTLKTAWFPEVTLHGFPRDKARNIRLKIMRNLLEYARRIGVDYIAFENLFVIKKRTKTNTSSGNRKITRFAKRQLLTHGIIMSLKLGFTTILVDPSGTTYSKEHEEIMRKKGLDRHMASAYIIARRGIDLITSTSND